MYEIPCTFQLFHSFPIRLGPHQPKNDLQRLTRRQVATIAANQRYSNLKSKEIFARSSEMNLQSVTYKVLHAVVHELPRNKIISNIFARFSEPYDLLHHTVK